VYGTQNTTQDERTRGWIFEERQSNKKNSLKCDRWKPLQQTQDQDQWRKSPIWRTNKETIQVSTKCEVDGRQPYKNKGKVAAHWQTSTTQTNKKTTLTRDIPSQARRVGKQTHNRWTKMQGEYKETIQDNLQRITQQTKKETNQRETSRAATTSWCRTHNKHQRQVRPKQKYTIPMRFMLDITCETISWMVNTHKNGVHNSATMQKKVEKVQGRQ